MDKSTANAEGFDSKIEALYIKYRVQAIRTKIIYVMCTMTSSVTKSPIL